MTVVTTGQIEYRLPGRLRTGTCVVLESQVDVLRVVHISKFQEPVRLLDRRGNSG